MLQHAVFQDDDCRFAGRSDLSISYRQSISLSAQLVDALEMFQADSDIRVLPVLDAEQRPVGALLERNMRSILFNPFGHALLKNPSYGGRLDEHIRICPTVEEDASVEALIEAQASARERCEGVIITRAGRFVGVIDSAILLRMAAERDAATAAAKARRYQRIEEASRRFRDDADALARALVAISGELSMTADTMAQRASRNGDHAAEVAAAAAQAAGNMAEVARRGTDLAGTWRDIQEQAGEAQTATGDAGACAAHAEAQMALLGEAAREIGNVVALIDGIARTTTMLSLNATIEAARAGEAGKGFAVVAGEIKALARQTRTAASDISDRAQKIRHAATDVSDGNARIRAAIAAVERLSASVTSAIDKQSAATLAIAENAEEASVATDHINLSADEIHHDAAAAASGAADILEHAQALSARAQTMHSRLSNFLDLVLAE